MVLLNRPKLLASSVFPCDTFPFLSSLLFSRFLIYLFQVIVVFVWCCFVVRLIIMSLVINFFFGSFGVFGTSFV